MAASFSSVFELANLTAPASGRTHAAKYLVSIAAGGGTATINMLAQMEFLGNFIGQAMTVDNTANADSVTITETVYGWTRIVPAGGAETFQYPAVAQQNFTFTVANDAEIVVSIFDWPAFPDSATDVSSAGPASNVNVVNAPTIHVAAGGTIAVTQDETPWAVAGSFTMAAGGTVAVTQDETPWVVSGTVGALILGGTIVADITGQTIIALQGGAPWSVDINTGSVTIAAGGTVAVTQDETPWVIGGTASVSLLAGGTVAIGGTVPVSGTLSVDITAADTVTAVLAAGGTVAVTQDETPWAVAGIAASGVAVSGNPLLDGARAANAEPAAVANGQAVAFMADLLGRGIVFPYANKENIVQGSTSTTGTGAATLIASPGTLLSNYVTSLQISNTGTSAVMVTLNDTAASQFIAPAGGGSNVMFPLPLKVAANTALTMTSSGATTTLAGNAQGFKGS